MPVQSVRQPIQNF